MITSRARQEIPAWSIGSSLVTVLPPKDPDDDDDEDEDKEDDEDEGEEEPAVIREPDELLTAPDDDPSLIERISVQ
jgi:hypothetical protein